MSGECSRRCWPSVGRSAYIGSSCQKETLGWAGRLWNLLSPYPCVLWGEGTVNRPQATVSSFPWPYQNLDALPLASRLGPPAFPSRDAIILVLVVAEPCNSLYTLPGRTGSVETAGKIQTSLLLVFPNCPVWVG